MFERRGRPSFPYLMLARTNVAASNIIGDLRAANRCKLSGEAAVRITCTIGRVYQCSSCSSAVELAAHFVVVTALLPPPHCVAAAKRAAAAWLFTAVTWVLEKSLVRTS
jgi:hypothetical protein